jgi:hypothetical protein
MPTIAIEPVLYRSAFFGLGAETVTPYSASFVPGDHVALTASQERYSFDYYEIWPPNTVYQSDCFYPTMFGFTASFDPKTIVVLNQTSSIVGTSLRTGVGIVARYR